MVRSLVLKPAVVALGLGFEFGVPNVINVVGDNGGLFKRELDAGSLKSERALGADGVSDGAVREGQKLVSTSLYADVYYRGQWYPICGHHFWDNDNGANLVCQKLGYGGGIRTNYHKYRVATVLDTDAMPIGKCGADATCLTMCNEGGNGWGDLNYNNGWCNEGEEVGVGFLCSGTQSEVGKENSCGEDSGCQDGDVQVSQKLQSTELYAQVSFQEKWYPICGHHLWDNDNGANLVCENLGYPKGGIRTNYHQYRDAKVFGTDAMPIGKCGDDVTDLTTCTEGGNGWGDLNYKNGWCNAGKEVGVRFLCFGQKVLHKRVKKVVVTNRHGEKTETHHKTVTSRKDNGKRVKKVFKNGDLVKKIVLDKARNCDCLSDMTFSMIPTKWEVVGGHALKYPCSDQTATSLIGNRRLLHDIRDYLNHERLPGSNCFAYCEIDEDSIELEEGATGEGNLDDVDARIPLRWCQDNGVLSQVTDKYRQEKPCECESGSESGYIAGCHTCSAKIQFKTKRCFNRKV